MKSFSSVCLAVLSLTVAFSNGLYQPYTVYHPGFLAGSLRASSLPGEGPLLAPEAQDELMGMIRLQSAKLTEISLAAKSKEEMQCFRKTVCVVGATMEKEERRIKAASGVTLATGIHQFTKILELMISDIEQSSYYKIKDFPHIYQVLGSYAVGSTTKDVSMCDRLFDCQTGLSDLTLPAYKRQGRGTCAAVSAVCPGVSIGCAVCGVFAPGTCGDQCIVAGLYCGTSLIGCAQEPKKEEDEN